MSDELPHRVISLDVVRVERPCPADWDGMRGDSRVRFCTQCDRHVHNLSAMRRADAERLLGSTSQLPCVQFVADAATGRIQTLDDVEDRRPIGAWWQRVAAAILPACLAAALGLSACSAGGCVTRGQIMVVGDPVAQPAPADDDSSAKPPPASTPPP